MDSNINLKNKKVLLVGLGILGGGVATARFLVERGAELTVTDMKDSEYLKTSIDKLADLNIKYVVGGHKEEDFLNNEIIVVNPGVPVDDPLIQLARDHGKQIENELTLFYKFCKSKNIVAVTGTRGKTTTVNWAHHFLKQKDPRAVLCGNSPENPFLASLEFIKEDTLVVLETPSFQLELVNESVPAPSVAVITNIYQDHLNRHKTIENYASIKANIFRGQHENDFLILNKNNDWTEYFLNQNPKSKVVLAEVSNVGLDDAEIEDFRNKWGEHNVINLSLAVNAVRPLGVTIAQIRKSLLDLPQIKFRQELILKNGDLEIYNDSAATSPEAGIVAINRYKNVPGKFILIAGGTDRELDFREWGAVVSRELSPENLILLSGSATEKMKYELRSMNYDLGKVAEFESLRECLVEALARSQGKTSIVFSPASKSFEKFKNEFDRGEQFNSTVAVFAI